MRINAVKTPLPGRLGRAVQITGDVIYFIVGWGLIWLLIIAMGVALPAVFAAPQTVLRVEHPGGVYYIKPTSLTEAHPGGFTIDDDTLQVQASGEYHISIIQKP